VSHCDVCTLPLIWYSSWPGGWARHPVVLLYQMVRAHHKGLMYQSAYCYAFATWQCLRRPVFRQSVRLFLCLSDQILLPRYIM